MKIFKSNVNIGVIHGDIKPQNVLVFKRDDGGTTFKVSDFGYSTLVAGKEGTVVLPKSRPWHAPEHHFGDFKVADAKKTDVYSFGILCLWILFRDRLSEISEEIITESTRTLEVVSFEGHFPLHRASLIERLKNDDKIVGLAQKLIQTTSGFDSGRKSSLEEFFHLSVARDSKYRTLDIGQLVDLLGTEFQR